MTPEQDPSMREKGLSPTSKELQTDEERAMLATHEELDLLQNKIENTPSEDINPEGLLVLQKQLEAKKQEAELAEQNFLGTNDIEQQNPLLQREKVALPDQQEIELKEEREKFVREYIDKNVKEMLNEWRTYLDESVNGAKAERLIALKSEQTIMKEAQQFIEEGGLPNFGGGDAELELCYFDSPEGRVQYVTGFEWHTAGGASIGLERDEITREDVKSREQLEEAEESGDLEQKAA